ncbi:Pirin-related protein [Herbaspirillum sp. CF444]|uniref:pirin family protein n=1 Tax=Herbaspirillum sp. CF444 TaxID=1144319 RepID=UPI0002724B50|nr:pirin family protein [Herbaspirillum sp. CF444]EJL94347.1 Pirin-related protein [Herbaspirillum sp. CF444]
MVIHAQPTQSGRGIQQQRKLVFRTRGHAHGAITRLASPGDVGELIKPFVFLDYFEADAADAPKFGFHPHSGIATLTLILSGQARYKETTGREGIIDKGGVEWMRAGSGVWHTGGLHGKERGKGFQLWVALPPELELALPHSQYLDASAFQTAGPARIIMGEYGGHHSIVAAPAGMTYLDVRLKAGDRWRFTPPKGHNVAWIAVHEGSVSTVEHVSSGEIAVFEESEDEIRFDAISDTAFVLGSAVKHPYDLVTGYYSVHTNAAALRQGEANIAQIGSQLRGQGVLRRA